MNRSLISAFLACVAAGATAGGQASKAAADSAFIAQARAATARFKDIEVAVGENYVKMGPDFPAMGEHWVKGELIMRGVLDPAQPAILTYARIGDSLTLTGAVYAIVQMHGDALPDSPSHAQWHDHVGTIDEESLLFHDRHDGESGAKVHLMVLHAWLWVPNPSGTFATDNWSLPFERLGVSAPGGSADAARMASLLTTGASYFARLFAVSGELRERDAGQVLAVLERHREQVARWWDALPRRDTLSPSDVAYLAEGWGQLKRDVARAVDPAAARRLERVLAAR